MKTTLPQKIQTIYQAQSYILELYKNDEYYHFDEDAGNIIWEDTSPTPEEIKKMDELVDQMWELFDPNAYVMGLICTENPFMLRIIEEKPAPGLQRLLESQASLYDFLETIELGDSDTIEHITKWYSWNTLISLLNEKRYVQSFIEKVRSLYDAKHEAEAKLIAARN